MREKCVKKLKKLKKFSNQKIDEKKIRIAGEKIFSWNIAVKNSRLVNCCEKFWVRKYEEKVKLMKNFKVKVTEKNSGCKIGGKNHNS